MLNTLNPFPSSLFESFDRLQRGLYPFADTPARATLRAVTRGVFPTVNVGKTADSVEVYVSLPGVDEKDVEVTIRQNVLTISGSRQPHADNNAESRVHRLERFRGDFRRTLTLPEDADPEQVHAAMKDGILHVKVARKQSAKLRRIAVD